MQSTGLLKGLGRKLMANPSDLFSIRHTPYAKMDVVHKRQNEMVGCSDST